MQPFSAPSQDLWNQMKQAISEVSMPLSAHHAVGNIFRQVEEAAAKQAMMSARPAPVTNGVGTTASGGAADQPN